jgi:hypothetical protein
MHALPQKKHPLKGALWRFLAWWLTFSGLYAMCAVCPFCGRVGCPVGGGSAVIVGGFFAVCVQALKNFFQVLYRMGYRRKSSHLS